MTQMQFAKACVLDRNYIGMLERGERNPTYITLLKLSEQLGVSVSQLID
ncbi:MAG: helix-turn-helix transcriptional regulator [Kiritimatiellae bacterium]|nr:helix-turn-helix transcriptional regulator [Kiritimatiellia bacterium]